MSSAGTSQPEEDDVGPIKDVFAWTVQIAGLPIAALGLVNIIATRYHVALLPLGRDIVANYQLATHYFIGSLYWLPLHFFHVTVPLWFHDIAVISIVSSSVSWKAFAGRGHPLTEWNVTLPEMLQWSSWPPGDDGTAFDWLAYITAVVPMFFVNLLAWIAGNLVYFVSRIHPFAGVAAASVRVALRGLLLIGLLILAEHFIGLIAPGGDTDRARSKRQEAGKYFLYFGVVVIGVVYFFGQLGAHALF